MPFALKDVAPMRIVSASPFGPCETVPSTSDAMCPLGVNWETIATGNRANTKPKITQKTVDQRREILIASRRRSNFFAP